MSHLKIREVFNRLVGFSFGNQARLEVLHIT
jgi:hypothetical protein